MKVNALTIGNIQLNNNVFLAPIAGYTDYAFRSLQLKLGAGLVFSELVSAKGLCYGGEGSFELLYSGDDKPNTAIQFFGDDPVFFRRACESEALKDFNIIDINMGCPVPKVFKNGEGSALLLDLKKAEKIISECAKTGKTVTVKIRIGIREGDNWAKETCIMAESAGASLVSIHGRVRDNYYSGEVNFNAIYKAKNSVSIPIIANGGLFTVKDCDDIISKTGADGVMLARGSLFDPFLIAKLTNTQVNYTLKSFIEEQLLLSQSQKGDERSAKEFRKFAPYYFKGMRDRKIVQEKINKALSVAEILDAINEFL